MFSRVVSGLGFRVSSLGFRVSGVCRVLCGLQSSIGLLRVHRASQVEPTFIH